jgi:hypothetical protein
MTTTSSIAAKLYPGFDPPKVPSMNGSSPYHAALNTGLQNAQQLNKLNQSLQGGRQRRGRGRKHRHYYGGVGVAGSQIVPQITPLYPSQNVPGTDGKNGIIASLVGTATQANANAAFDKQVSKGGSRKIRKTKRFMGSHLGVHQNYGSWPSCYSGGKSRSRVRKRKSRGRSLKNRKTRRH